jgi:hypothetical protein
LAAEGRAKGGKSLNLFVPAVLQRVSRIVDGGSWCAGSSKGGAWPVVETGCPCEQKAAEVGVSEAALGLVVADATPDQGSSNSEIVGPGSWMLGPGPLPGDRWSLFALVLWLDAVFFLMMPALAPVLGPAFLACCL